MRFSAAIHRPMRHALPTFSLLSMWDAVWWPEQKAFPLSNERTASSCVSSADNNRQKRHKRSKQFDRSGFSFQYAACICYWSKRWKSIADLTAADRFDRTRLIVFLFLFFSNILWKKQKNYLRSYRRAKHHLLFLIQLPADWRWWTRFGHYAEPKGWLNIWNSFGHQRHWGRGKWSREGKKKTTETDGRKKGKTFCSLGGKSDRRNTSFCYIKTLFFLSFAQIGGASSRRKKSRVRSN